VTNLHDDGPLSTEDLRTLASLLRRYAIHELDQFEHWRIETPPFGSVYVDLSVKMANGATDASYATIWPLPAHLTTEP
jgi:hypothetical protein